MFNFFARPYFPTILKIMAHVDENTNDNITLPVINTIVVQPQPPIIIYATSFLDVSKIEMFQG